VDWKSSNYLYLEYLYQTAAYMHAYNEEIIFANPVKGGTPSWVSMVATDRWVIRLGKEDGEFDPWYAPVETFSADWNGFYLALMLTRQVAATEQRIADAKAVERARLKAIKDEQRAVKAAAEAEEKARIKDEKAQARLEALALACPYSKKYKGSRPPSCTTNSGGPCLACFTKYEEVQASKARVGTEQETISVVEGGLNGEASIGTDVIGSLDGL
jgi:hypothetical protein